jgi:protein subunit release factor A
MNKQHVFSITKDDFVFEFFRCGGKGGQKQNKTSSGVRIRHPASGCVAESREERSQHQNKAIAFRRLANSTEFRNWIRMEVARRVGLQDEIELRVKQAMRDEFLKVEAWDKQDKQWKEINHE